MIDEGVDSLFGELQAELHDSHVWLSRGYDLSVAHGWLGPKAGIEPCPFCCPGERVMAPVLSDDIIWSGVRTIHYVACGGCGAQGPWGDTESQAIAQWARAWGRR